MPLVRRLPFKRGFTNIFRVHYQEVNVDLLQDRFDDGTEITPETLAEAGLIRDADGPVVILGRGDLDKKFTVHAHRFTKGAAEKILAAGGATEVLEIKLRGAFATVKKRRKAELARMQGTEE